jgi:hypothetical protein
VTSNSTQVLAVMAPALAIAPLVGAGRLSQVIPVSVQLLSVKYKDGPFDEPLVTQSRSLALWTAPVTPLTVKRR